MFEQLSGRLRRAVVCAPLLAVVAACPPVLPVAVPPPTRFTEITGDGSVATALLGPMGGRVALGPDGPTLLVPQDALGSAGTTFAIRRAEATTEGAPLSVAFEVTPPVAAAAEHPFQLSIRLARLPERCEERDLRLAVERPNDTGPADGRGSPTLRWSYDPVSWQHETVAATVPQLHGQRLRFVCLNGVPQ